MPKKAGSMAVGPNGIMDEWKEGKGNAPMPIPGAKLGAMPRGIGGE